MDRPHTGSRRNEAARQAILEASLRLLAEEGYARLSIGAIARAAGVGRQTIYRWWSSKADIVLDALLEQARETIPRPTEGPLEERLRTFLRATFRGAADAQTATVLRALAAEAQRDPAFAQRFQAFTALRRDALSEVLAADVPRADLPVVVDLAFGLLWYRLLLGHRPLDARSADRAARLLAAAVGSDG
jgi:AcrR family transcriptional regulator